MSTLKTVWDCLFTPRLIKIYGGGPLDRLYEPSALESWGDQIIQSFYMIWKIGVYTSPLIVGVLYHRDYFGHEGLTTLTKFFTSIGVILVVSFCMRSVGRTRNPAYQKFMKTLQLAQTELSPNVKRQLSQYDFEFHSWPIEFRWSDMVDPSKQYTYLAPPVPYRNILHLMTMMPCYIIGYIAMHTFGIKLVYPGSIGLLQLFLAQGLTQGRTKLQEVNNGERFKLLSRDDNEIDCMFVDRRNATVNGSTLVICCEGNAGFYEIGIMCTPIDAGYSVLGWNHPGFGGSTGKPYPAQEQNAIDVVMQFAIYKLGFKIENIVLFGWSIGGYTATWAAMNYPDVKGVILDATFDDIMPLALNYMPVWTESIVRLAIRENANLNVCQQLIRYPGPILLIRRTEDEIIAIKETDIATNRGNHLLIKLLRYRYPFIYDDSQIRLVMDYLCTNAQQQDLILQKYDVNSDLCASLLISYVSEHTKSYPMKLGEEMSDLQRNQMALFLIQKYMRDYKSTHCTPLPVDMFQMPWDVHQLMRNPLTRKPRSRIDDF